MLQVEMESTLACGAKTRMPLLQMATKGYRRALSSVNQKSRNETVKKTSDFNIKPLYVLCPKTRDEPLPAKSSKDF